VYAKIADALGAAGLIENGKVNAQRLGKRLQFFRNKRLNGRWFERIQSSSKHPGRWFVVEESRIPEELPPSLYMNCQNEINAISIEGKGTTPLESATPPARQTSAAEIGRSAEESARSQADNRQLSIFEDPPPSANALPPTPSTPVAPAAPPKDDEGGL
jgi:hypothetical protein